MFDTVGSTSLLEDGKFALGSDEDLVAGVMLANEVTEELFVDACSVNDPFIILVRYHGSHGEDLTYSSVPECAPKFSYVKKNNLGLSEGKVSAKIKGKTHGAEAR
jgi:hypothetical protein